MAENPLHLVALGASTPVGRDAWSSAAAVRAGISGFREHPHMIDSVGEPMRLAIAPWLDIQFQGPARFDALLSPAIEQALPFPLTEPPPARIALALALPPPRPGLSADLEGALRARIADRFRDRFVKIATFAVGHAAGFVAMQSAWKRIGEGTFDACLVAGVESYLAPETLEWLERNGQLHGAGPLNNAWGFIPGEGAAAVLLVSEPLLERLRLESMARLLSVGVAMEHKGIQTQTVCTGEGLTAAFRSGLAALPSRAKITDVVCDMNGEPYRADEFGFATLRTKEYFEAASDFIAPADCWGDVSAASMPLALVLSTIAARKAYANGRYAFVWASSESGERGAALLETPVSAGGD